jgi:hypothetical protein
MNDVSIPAVDERTKKRGRALWILAAILAVAAGLRLHRLGETGFWFDERASVMSAAGHFGDWMNLPIDRVIDSPPDLSSVSRQGSIMAAWRSPDFHPPLYAILLRIWRQIIGESDAEIRGLSVLASLLAIVFLFDLGRTLAGERCALWACAIMAVAEPQIRYAQEARPYMLWQTLGMAACAAAARLVVFGPGWRRAISLSLCLLGLVLTHYLAVFSAAAVVVWCGFYLRGRALRQAAIAAAVSLVILAFIGGGIIQRAYQAHGDTDWLGESPAGHLATTLQRAAILPTTFLARPLDNSEKWADAGAVIYLLPWLMRGKLARLCGIWLLAGVGSVFALDLIRSTLALALIRFTLVAAPAVYLTLASLPARRPILGEHFALADLMPIVAIVYALLNLGSAYDQTWKGQWPMLGADVRALARPGDIVVIASPETLFMYDPAKMYEGVSYYSHPIPCPVLLLDRPADAATSPFPPTPSRRAAFAEAVSAIADAGYTGVELMADVPHAAPATFGPDLRRQLRAQLDELHLAVSNVNAFTLFADGDTYHPTWIEADDPRRHMRD